MDESSALVFALQLQFDDDEARWTAVAQRDVRADGTFYYSVRTTGVYCRPGCPARLARRANVRFHATCDAAEAAGFRPCMRCRPRDATRGQALTAAIVAACRQIESAESAPSLDALARTAGISRFHFHRSFKALTGVTPKAYALAQRAQRVRAALPASATVTDAIYRAGFNASSRFYAHATTTLGMKPASYRRGGAGATIRYALDMCSLGHALVAATEIGICALALGDAAEGLISELRARFPQATLVAGDQRFVRWVGKVLHAVDTPAAAAQLPLDVRGSAFQHRVWEALRALAPGHTATYAELAARIGQPSAVRAVAHACASNPVALAIPCHRVIRSDGGLAGYRWGLERKRALLAREGALAPRPAKPVARR